MQNTKSCAFRFFLLLILLLFLHTSYVAYNRWANTGKLRNECWPTDGFVNHAPINYLSTMASGRISANLSFIYHPNTPQQWPNKIIFYWSNSVLKLLGLRWLVTGMPTHHLPTVSTICQRWPNYLCYLGHSFLLEFFFFKIFLTIFNYFLELKSDFKYFFFHIHRVLKRGIEVNGSSSNK